MAAPHPIPVSPVALGDPAGATHGGAARDIGPTAALRWIPETLLVGLAPLFLSAPRGVVIGAGAALAVALASVLGWRRRDAALATVPRERRVPVGTANDVVELAPELSWALAVASDAIVVTDVRGTITQASARACAILGQSVRCGEMFPPRHGFSGLADCDAFTRALRQLYADPGATESGEISAVHDERLRVYEWKSEPVRNAAAVIVGRGFLLSDRTQERELAMVRREFLSTVSHELRTPLTSVKGSLQLVLGKASTLSTIERELLAISLKNTDRLIRLINDILDISQLELGKMDLTFASVAPGSLIEEAIAGLRAYAAGRDIAIGCELDPDLPLIAGDRDRLIQVLTNLVSNAVKFSPTGGRVLVRATCTGDELCIAVRDWGVGIRPCDHGRLFQRFQRLHAARSEEPGTGLGLAISKAIVDRHGGRITVDSEEDLGSTFAVVLPVAVATATAAKSAEGGEALEARRPTLLLIDDDADFGTVLEVSLGASYRLLRVERGVQALDVARVERPDLVLLDVVLPDLSGYDVLRILQHSEATRAIPIVMLTVQPERMLARGLGAVDVVAKPVDVESLRRAIERALRAPGEGTALRVAVGPLSSRTPASLCAALEAGGHAVFTAADTWELVRCADEHHADVAIVEAVRDVDGDGAIAFLRGHATTRRLPVVLLAGETAGPLAAGCTPVAAGLADAEIVRVVEDAVGRARVRPGSAEIA
jgi:signal transduction histidine kinase/DNA-binding response OmpR family regulator